MAEDCGLIIPIGEWVLDKACRQILDWQAMGLKLPRIGVNLSAAQFRQPDLATRIARILKRTGMVPGGVELEITERIWMRDIKNTENTLLDLKALGLQIALDDFGTGFSNLSYLKSYPISRLKIDKSFIAATPNDPDDTSIVKAIIDLVANLRLEVIAEGVETAEQLEFLSQHGCHEIQGFLFHTPVPPEEFAELLAQQPFLRNGK
jgi:EAL domain-containing protein (putative c-di-GMP-specific phosphodiesterase class I)